MSGRRAERKSIAACGDSKAAQEGGHRDAQRFGQFPEGFDRDGLGAALDLADVNGMKVGALGKLLLGETGAAAELPDVAANGFADCLNTYHLLHRNRNRAAAP